MTQATTHEVLMKTRTLSLSAHAVIRKWILLSDPEDKMAGAKVII